MKLDTKGKIRLTEFGIGFLAASAVSLHDKENVLATNLCMLPYFVSMLRSFRIEKKTDDYKELEILYKEVIKNTANLMRELGIEDPVPVFAAYMHMYRNGYLSVNKEYKYSTKMKDFTGLLGLDVIRGLGVCRSVASMHRDVCEELDMNASLLMVKANNAIPQIEKLCDKDKPIPDDKTKHFVKAVVACTKKIPIANHTITTVEKDGINYILDPMNDGLLYKGEKNKLYVANNKDYYMSLNIPLTEYSRLLYNMKIEKLKVLKKQIAKPSIEYDQYKYEYLKALELCKKNEELFEEFYIYNKDLYEEIDKKSAEYSGLILRATGFDQVKKIAMSKKLDPVRETFKNTMESEEVKKIKDAIKQLRK